MEALNKKLRNVRKRWHIDLYPRYADAAMRKTEISFMQNQALLNQNIDWEKNGQYIYLRKIHALLELHDIKDDNRGAHITRIGKSDDGGYIMVKPFSREKVAYSIGISDDVSWDKEMAANGYDVWQYDHTISALPEENIHFHWKRIGLAGKIDKNNRLSTLEHCMEKNGHSNLVGGVLKMDIEGWEWDVLEYAAEETLDRFDQIIMEMHWIISRHNEGQVLKCLEKLSKTHVAVHIHGTNFEPVTYCRDLITPDVIEVTMLNRKYLQTSKSEKILPIDSDRPCWPDTPDIILGKWNV